MVRDALLVARFDLGESLRSRRALVLLLLYLAGSMAGAGGFVTLLQEIESAVAAQLSVAQTQNPGAMTSTLLASDQFLDVLAGLLGDRALAAELVAVPPMALFYSWMATFFAPVLVVMTSSDTVTGELSSGSARFALFRTDRLSWAMGKLGGQTLTLGVGLLLGAIGVHAVGWIWLGRFEPGATAWWLLRLTGRAWIYGFAYVGIVLGVSQLTRSVNWARGLSLLALIGAGVASSALGSERLQRKFDLPVLMETVRQLFPGAHKIELWRPELVDRLPPMLMLCAIGVTAFFVGHLVFARRDA